jgi:hypothetical protein
MATACRTGTSAGKALTNEAGSPNRSRPFLRLRAFNKSQLRRCHAIVDAFHSSWETSRARKGFPRWRDWMRNAKWLAAAGLLVVTAGCVEQSGSYPTTYGYNPGYGSSGYRYPNYSYANSYYSQPTYYRSQPTYYRPATYYTPAPQYHRPIAARSATATAFPTVMTATSNGDGVADKYQRSRC